MATIDVTGGGTAKPAPAAAKKDDTLKLELDLTKDTLSRGDKTSGLGRVFVQMDSNALADDIADLALDALKRANVPGPWRIRVIDDAAVLRGADILALLTHQAGVLATAVAAALPQAPQVQTRTIVKSFNIAAFPLAAVAGTALQGVSALSKLFAHDYQLSGREVPADGLGFDLLVAQKIEFKNRGNVTITVERLARTDVTVSDVFRTVAKLDEDARTKLAPLVTSKAADAAWTAAVVTALTAQRTGLGAQLAELVKHLDKEAVVTELARTRDELSQLDAAIAAAADDAAHAAAEHDAILALANDIAEFITDVATPPPSGGRAPLIEAARAEAYGKDDGELVLYARLLAGGMDEIVDLRTVRSDVWTGLAGAVAEFALLDGPTVVACGTRSALEATTMHLNEIDRARRHRIEYAGVPDFRP